MRKALLALLLLASPAYAEFEGGGGGGGSSIPGISSNVNGEYPHSGTVIIWIDDGLRWTINDVDKAGHSTSPEGWNSLMEIFQGINEDSSLAGTPWEMEFVLGVNIYGSDADAIPGNGLQGYNGQVGNAVPDTSQSMFDTELVTLSNSGVAEIALHGANAQPMDPYGSIGATPGVTAPWGLPGSNLTTSTEGMIVDGYKALHDTIGIDPVYSYMTNGHRIDHLGTNFMASYFRNCRAGWIHNTGTSEYPSDAGATNSSNIDKGVTLQFTRGNYDLMANWWHGYDGGDNMIRSFLPFTPANRMWFGHCNPPNNSNVALTNIAEWKYIFSQIAESKGTIIITLHDQNCNPPSTPANTSVAVTTDNEGTVISPANPLEGIEIVFRAAAHYACNGLYNRMSQPKLQVIGMDKAMNKRASVAHLGGVINYIDNFKMEADTASYMQAGDAGADKPWGYPSAFAYDTGDARNRDVWADSLWTYRDPATADDAGDNFFGYFNATGVISSAITNVQDFKPLPIVVNVIPGSIARISCYANASHLPDAGPTDSLSSAFIDIKVTPFSHYEADRSDTTNSWLGIIAASPNYYKVTDDLDGPTGTTNAYAAARVQGRFHSRDENANLRAAGYTSGNWYLTGTNTDDKSMRWRPFWTEVEVPPETEFLYIEFIPSRQTGAGTYAAGFALATACTTQIAGIEVQGIPR